MPPNLRKRAAAGSSPSRNLPTELLTLIVNELDPIADRPTLISLLRVSHTVWDVAARHLYRDVVLSDVQLSRMVKNLRRPRAQKCFGFIERLKLSPPPDDKIMAKVYAAAAASGDLAPLFPNVTRLILEDPFPNGDAGRKYGLKPTFKRLPDEGVFLFDAPSVCVRRGTWSQDRLEYLPCRSISSSNLTVHCEELSDIWGSSLPRPYRTLRIYWPNAHNERDIDGIDYAADFDNDAGLWALELPLVFYPRISESTERKVTRRLARARSRMGLEDKGQVNIVFTPHPPPCEVCGES